MIVYCEYLHNPIGIDMEQPRFSWIVENEKGGGRQESYHIVVYKDDPSCSCDNSMVWDSKIINSDQTLNVSYEGKVLETAETYYYKVTVTDEKGCQYESDINTFTMGLMEQEPWKASWIGGPWMEEWAFWFRSSFKLGKEVKNAFIYVVSPNYYVLTLNGSKCSEDVLQNANTDSRKTVLYATYQVKNQLLSGENVIGIELGNGWKALDMSNQEAGLGEHLFSVQMLLRYVDGTTEWIYSDSDNWNYCNRGPMLKNSIYLGENYDARKEMLGWNKPGYDMNSAEVEWYQAVEFEPEEGKVKAQYLEPIRVVKTIKPVNVYEVSDGSYTFDMGQNFAGWGRLIIHGKRGTEIKLKYSELIHDDYTVNQITLRTAKATDTYILGGGDEEIYEPRFTFHGFRYVQVFGLPYSPVEDTLIGCVVRSAVEKVGSFSCDNKLLNQLQKNIGWTEESNLHSVPTDCPQRDERLGWINDMTVRNECALYNYRLASLYTKWMQDIRDTQGEKTGAISDTAPFRVFGCRPADPVGASMLLIPWNMYRHYKDKRIIEDCYEANKKYFDYLRRNSTGYIMRWAQMGDWAPPVGQSNENSIGGGAVSTTTPTRLVATAFFYYDCCLMAKMARAIGREVDEAYYLTEATKIREAFISKYYNAENKYVGTNSQGCNTIALYMDLVPKEDREYVLKNLVEDITVKNDMHLTTGNLCSRYIIEVLLENGYEDIAYSLLTQTTYPSWGYMIENGATTIWERWEKVVSEGKLSLMASHNHPMYGSVGVCFYKFLAGIDADDDKPGFKQINIHPIIPEAMSYAQASIETMRGKVSNGWKKNEDGSFVMNTVIPFNCIGRLYIPVINAQLNHATILINNNVVYANGSMKEDSGAKYVMTEKNYIVFEVGAGEFESLVK